MRSFGLVELPDREGEHDGPGGGDEEELEGDPIRLVLSGRPGAQEVARSQLQEEVIELNAACAADRI